MMPGFAGDASTTSTTPGMEYSMNFSIDFAAH
jgi:hypothetical protein